MRRSNSQNGKEKCLLACLLLACCLIARLRGEGCSNSNIYIVSNKHPLTRRGVILLCVGDFITRRGFYYASGILLRVGDFITCRFRCNIITRNKPITHRAVYYYYAS